RCLKNHIIPKYLRLRTPITSSRITSAAGNLSRLCLREELHRITVKLNNLRNQIEKLKQKLKCMFNDTDYAIVVETSEKARESALRISKITQIKKFNKLIEEKNTTNEIDVNASSTIDRTKWVINFSSRELSSNVIKVLEKGLNFNVTVNKLKPEDVIPNIEVALGSIDKTKAEEIRAQCA
ncbi:unnamed protein product, partial [Trichobilharzia regenti]